MNSMNFWTYKTIEELTYEQWESLCAKCGKCCLVKLEDEGIIEYTCVACRYLNLDSCTCNNYENRNTVAPDCIVLTPHNINTLDWLPSTCSYKIFIKTQSLPNWHYLVTKNPDSVHCAGMSIRNRAVSEDTISEEELEYFCAPDLG